MNGINRVVLVGNIGKDPELKTSEKGTPYLRFSMATHRYYKLKTGEPVEKTDWHYLIMWRKMAELGGKLLRKGSLVYVEGELRTHSYVDKDGNTKFSTDIEVENFTLLNRTEHESAKEVAVSMLADQTVEVVAEEEDLPF